MRWTTCAETGRGRAADGGWRDALTRLVGPLGWGLFLGYAAADRYQPWHHAADVLATLALGAVLLAWPLTALLRQHRANDIPARLVINKSGIAKRPEIKLDDFSAALNLKPLAVIPFEAQLFGTAANNGQMIAETDPKSPIAAAFELIARTVTGRADAKRQKPSMLSSLFKRARKGA